MTPKTISVDNLKSNLDEILRRVKVGESFTVLDEGMPVMDLIPSRVRRKQEAHVAIKNILDLKQYPISEQELVDLQGRGRY